MNNIEIFFFAMITFVISQRLFELQIAKRNTSQLFQRGAVEFGRSHYWVLVALHSLFVLSLVLEATLFRLELSNIWYLYLSTFILAQFGRVWVIRTMHGRWTTRVLVLPGEKLVHHGPFQYVSHPNYIIVAVEILTLPLIFNLYVSAAVFSLLNAFVLLAIRLPVEKQALNWSQRQ